MKTAKHQYLIKIWLVKNIHIQLHQWFISTLCISFAVTYCRNHFCSRFIDVVYTAQSSPSLCQITSSFQYSYSKGSETLSAFIILRLQSTVINQWNKTARERSTQRCFWEWGLKAVGWIMRLKCSAWRAQHSEVTPVNSWVLGALMKSRRLMRGQCFSQF